MNKSRHNGNDDWPALEIRPFAPGDERAINDGFNEIFQQQRPLKEWERKFRIDGQDPKIMVCVDRAGRIVAHYGATTQIFAVNGRSFVAGQIVDSYALRRSDVVAGGLFVKTAHAFFEHFCGPGKLEIIYGFPGLRALRLGRLKLGYDFTWPVTVWRRSTQPGWLRAARQAIFPRPSPVGEETLAQADALWSRAQSAWSPGMVRDRAWLDARRIGIGGVPYEVVAQARNDALSAWAIFESSSAITRIVDILWDGRDIRCLSAILDRIAVNARQRGSLEIELWSPAFGCLAQGLGRLGWTHDDEPRGCHVGIRVFSADIEPADVSGGFHYAFGDSDLI